MAVEYIRVCAEVFKSQRAAVKTSHRRIKTLEEDQAVLKAVIAETSHNLKMLNETAHLACPKDHPTSLDWIKNIRIGLKHLTDTKNIHEDYSQKCQKMFKTILGGQIPSDATDMMIRDLIRDMPPITQNKPETKS